MSPAVVWRVANMREVSHATLTSTSDHTVAQATASAPARARWQSGWSSAAEQPGAENDVHEEPPESRHRHGEAEGPGGRHGRDARRRREEREGDRRYRRVEGRGRCHPGQGLDHPEGRA